MTESYYHLNAQEYFDNTVNLDLSSIHTRFLAHVLRGGFILDAGCGSGRDGKSFLEAGYKLQAFDASPAMVFLAEKYLNQKVDLLRFEDLDYKDQFDGIWACASLLHVPRASLNEVFRKLHRSLKNEGVVYVSFKYGNSEVESGGRRFTNMNERSLSLMLKEIRLFTEIEVWTSSDCRPGKAGDNWLNAILKSSEEV